MVQDTARSAIFPKKTFELNCLGRFAPVTILDIFLRVQQAVKSSQNVKNCKMLQNTAREAQFLLR